MYTILIESRFLSGYIRKLFCKGWCERISLFRQASDKSRSSLRGRALNAMRSGAVHRVDSVGTKRRVGIVYCVSSINPPPSPISSRIHPASLMQSANMSQGEKLCYGSQITCRINASPSSSSSSPVCRSLTAWTTVTHYCLHFNTLHAWKNNFPMWKIFYA